MSVKIVSYSFAFLCDFSFLSFLLFFPSPLQFLSYLFPSIESQTRVRIFSIFSLNISLSVSLLLSVFFSIHFSWFATHLPSHQDSFYIFSSSLFCLYLLLVLCVYVHIYIYKYIFLYFVCISPIEI